jgi:hypothetical protein
MAARRAICSGFLTMVVAVLSSPAVGAGEPEAFVDGNPSAADSAAAGELAEPPRPWISSTVSDGVRSRLEAGFELAISRLQERPECRQLFVELGGDGIEALSTTLYYPAGMAQERQVCRRATAFTNVGAAPTIVCRRIERLPVSGVARVLVHEALHHAGLDEWPNDPKAPRPREIDGWVSAACGL